MTILVVYINSDLASMAEIGNQSMWFVPKGLKKWMHSHGITNVFHSLISGYRVGLVGRVQI
jgi:hypothetical protein